MTEGNYDSEFRYIKKRFGSRSIKDIKQKE
jgi:hypothetical protein